MSKLHRWHAIPPRLFLLGPLALLIMIGDFATIAYDWLDGRIR
jgi:hypothetical protein